MKLSAATRTGVILALLTALTLAKGALWIGITPVFLVADEPAHFDNIQYRAENHAAPHYRPSAGRIDKVMQSGASPEVKKLWFGSIPKHYYAHAHAHEREHLEAELRDLAMTAGGRDTDGQSPAMGYPGLYYQLAVPAYDAFQDSSVVTRIMAVRCVSLLFGVCAVLFTFLAAQLLVRDDVVCFVAAAMVALQPMESQMTAAVNNDAGVVGFAAGLFYFQVRALAELPALPSAKTFLGLAVSAICLLLTKPTGYGILPGVGVLAIAVLVVHHRDRRVQIMYAVGALLFVVGLYVERARLASMLPGDGDVLGPYGHATFDSFLQSLEPSYLDYLFRSAWGQFGWLDFSMHANWVARLRAALPFVEIGTVVVFATHALRDPEKPFWVRAGLFAFCIQTVVVGVAFILYVEHRFRLTGILGVIQGRNFLFVLPAFAIWSSIAICAVVPRRLRGWSALFLFVGMVALHIGCLLTIMRQHYVR